MIVITLSILVAILVITTLVLSAAVISLVSTRENLFTALRHKEEIYCRIHTLILSKFNYYVPFSDKYLSMEEIKHELEIANKS